MTILFLPWSKDRHPMVVTISLAPPIQQTLATCTWDTVAIPISIQICIMLAPCSQLLNSTITEVTWSRFASGVFTTVINWRFVRYILMEL